jgi:type I restriction enzyme, S subunit
MTAWANVELGSVCQIINGGTPKSEVVRYWGGNNQWITPKDMGKLQSKFVEETERQITDAGLQNCSAKLSPPQSVILSSRAPIGHLAINLRPMATNQGCKTLIPSATLDFLYLYYFLSHSKQLLNDLGSGTTFKELSSSKLSEVPIPLPPLAIQKAIVAKLDAAFASIDTAIAAAEKNAENADKLYKNEVDQIFNNFDCELQVLGNNAEISYGYTAKSSSEFKGPHYLRITDIQDNAVDWDSVPRCVIGEREFKRFKLETGDIVFARTGATTGKSFLLTTPPHAVLASYLIKVAVKKSVFKPEFINQYFQSASYWSFVNAGISGAAQGGFNASKLSSLPIPVPPLDEQDLAVKRLLDFQSHTKRLADIYVRKTKALRQLKQSLLQQAFSGQLVDA